jgi:hypothetical protein
VRKLETMAVCTLLVSMLTRAAQTSRSEEESLNAAEGVQSMSCLLGSQPLKIPIERHEMDERRAPRGVVKNLSSGL